MGCRHRRPPGPHAPPTPTSPARIGTGDDCISIINGSFGVKMRDIDCGPGHGISIGSLGKGGAFAAVADVALDSARISRAQNGVRIKTW